MAKTQKQNAEETKEIFAAAPIEEVTTKEERVVVAPQENVFTAKECAIVVRPKGGKLDVLAVENGVEIVIEQDADFAVAAMSVMRMAKKMCLVARGEGSLKP